MYIFVINEFFILFDDFGLCRIVQYCHDSINYKHHDIMGNKILVYKNSGNCIERNGRILISNNKDTERGNEWSMFNFR